MAHMGRPKKAVVNKHVVGVRLNDVQWLFVKEQAARQHVKLSTLVREWIEGQRQQSNVN